jgi:hypothetical protein
MSFMATVLPPASLDRMVRAVEMVRKRLLKAAATLEAAGIPYAVTGGNAVAAWVSRVDEAAARNTQDVDVLLNRADLPRAIAAMEAAGFVYRHAASMDMFLDGPEAKARDAVHVILASEKVRPEYPLPAASVGESVPSQNGDFRHVDLGALVRMKLTSYRRKDQVHILDLIGVGLIDDTWPNRLPPPLGERLQHLLDTPDG